MYIKCLDKTKAVFSKLYKNDLIDHLESYVSHIKMYPILSSSFEMFNIFNLTNSGEIIMDLNSLFLSAKVNFFSKVLQLI